MNQENHLVRGVGHRGRDIVNLLVSLWLCYRGFCLSSVLSFFGPPCPFSSKIFELFKFLCAHMHAL